jgi:uncharacterized protein YggT (Ycf19 family)
METFLRVVQGLAMYAAVLLAGQGFIYVLSFGRAEANAVYRFIRLLTSPVTKVVRLITPKKIADQHVPFVAFFLLFWLWFFLAVRFGSAIKAAG